MLDRRRVYEVVIAPPSGQQEYWQQIQSLFGTSIIAQFPMWEASGTVMTDVKNARNGVYGGTTPPTLGQPPIRDGHTCILIPTATSGCNAFTTGLRDAFSGLEGSVMFDAKIDSTWADGTTRYITRFAVDANNYLQLTSPSASPSLEFTYKAGGTATLNRTKINQTDTARFHIALTWSRSNNRARFYYNGVQQGADLVIASDWAGTLATAMFGAYSSGFSNPWKGWMQNALVLNCEATPEEVASVNSFSLGAVQAPDAGGFSVVFVPDTQALVNTAAYRQELTDMMNWIVANKTTLNIQAVMTEGDVVETVGTAAEWTAADASYDVLDTDGSIPYLVAIGEHDYDTLATYICTTFNANFGQARYTGQSWWNGGFFEADHAENAYNIVTIGGTPYLFITLEVVPRADVLTWLDNLLTTHADKKAIIANHRYLQSDNTRSTEGTAIWNVVKTHDNVIWVQCGNYVSPDGYGRLTSQTDGGKSVHQVLFNTQTLEWGGPWLRVVKFHPGGNIVSETYSPTTRESKRDDDNQFTVAYPS